MAKIKFLPKEKKLVATKFGANLGVEMLPILPSLTAWAKELGFQTYYLNNYRGSITDSEAATVNTFLSETKATIALHYLIQSKEVADAFPQYFDDLLRRFPSPEFVQLDNETIQVTKGSGVSMTNADYIARSQKLFAYKPQLKYSWDAGRMYRDLPGSPTAQRNDIVAAQADPPAWARQYRQLGDRVAVAGTPFTTDSRTNLTIIDNLFEAILPADDAQFFSRFPNLAGQPIIQFFVEDNNAGQKIAGKPLGNYAIGRAAVHFLKYTEIYPFVFWFQLTNLFPKNNPDAEFTSLKRIIPAFKYRYVVPLEIKIDGVTGIGVSDGIDSYGMILNNATANEIVIQASDIKIYGKTVPAAFVRDSGYSDSWDTPTRNEIVAETSLAIKRNSTNFVKFNTGAIS